MSTKNNENSANTDTEVMPTSEKLARELEAAKAPVTMVQRARDGYYGDYTSPLPAPQMSLYADCVANNLMEMADRTAGGEFSATREEAEAWAASPEGRELLGNLGSVGIIKLAEGSERGQ